MKKIKTQYNKTKEKQEAHTHALILSYVGLQSSINTQTESL